MEKTIYVNRPASRTWNRLGVNEAAVRWDTDAETLLSNCLLYTSPSPRDA